LHTLPAHELYAAHLAPYLAQAGARLEGELREAQAQNQELMARVNEQRRVIEGLLGGLEGVVRDLEGAVGGMGNEAGGLRREAMELEGVLTTVTG
jgi:kinetochore protein NNF1